MNIARNGDWVAEESHTIYRTTSSSSVVGWVLGRRTARAAPAKTFTTLDVHLDGVLNKQGSWRKNWKERFFVLRRDAKRLSYYDSRRSLKLLGEVMLVAGSRRGTVVSGDGFCFSVKCAADGSLLQLQATTEKERERWVTALRAAIDEAARAGGGRPPAHGQAGADDFGGDGAPVDLSRDSDEDDDDGRVEAAAADEASLNWAFSPRSFSATAGSVRILDAADARDCSNAIGAEAVGLQVTLHLHLFGAAQDAEEGLFLSMAQRLSMAQKRRCKPDESSQTTWGSMNRGHSSKGSLGGGAHDGALTKAPPDALDVGDWVEVARTEVVKAGDSGAFVSESASPGAAQRLGVDVVRQFSVLLPLPRGETLLSCYRRAGLAQDLSTHALLLSTVLDESGAAKLLRQPCARVVEIGLDALDVAGDAGAQESGDEDPAAAPAANPDVDAAHPPSWAGRPRSHLWTLAAAGGARPRVSRDKATTRGRLLVVGVAARAAQADSPRGAVTYAAQGFQFRSTHAAQGFQFRSTHAAGSAAVYGHVVACEELAWVPPAAALPVALVELVVRERESSMRGACAALRKTAAEKRGAAAALRGRAADAADEARRRALARVDAAGVSELAGVRANFVIKLSRDDEDTALQRSKELDRAAHRLDLEANAVESVALEVDASLAYLATTYRLVARRCGNKLDDYARQEEADDAARPRDGAPPLPPRPRPPLRSASSVAPSHAAYASGAVSLPAAVVQLHKRSTEKKEPELLFLPTNMVWHQLRARRLHAHGRPHVLPRTGSLGDREAPPAQPASSPPQPSHFRLRRPRAVAEPRDRHGFPSAAADAAARDGAAQASAGSPASPRFFMTSPTFSELGAASARLGSKLSSPKKSPRASPQSLPRSPRARSLGGAPADGDGQRASGGGADGAADDAADGAAASMGFSHRHSSITFGACAAHGKRFGFKDGGLWRLLDRAAEADDPDAAARAARRGEPSPRLRRALALQASGGLECATASAAEACVAAALDREPAALDRGPSHGAADERPADGANAACVRATAALRYASQARLGERLDVVCSQALALAGAHVFAVLSLAAEEGNAAGLHARVLERALRPTKCAGEGRLLLGIECLLSTHLDELGMLEDLVVAAEWLATVRFRFVALRGAKRAAPRECWRVARAADGSGAVVVDVVVYGALEAAVRRASHAATAAPESSSGGEVLATTRIDAALFTQGVNEWQTVANTLSTHAGKQAAVNARGIDVVSAHVDRAANVARELAGASGASDEKRRQRVARAEAEGVRWRRLLDQASLSARDATRAKNVHVLLHTSDVCRALSGSHAICCKSGKDRTSMAATLEQARLLAQQLGVFDERKVCEILRRHGGRRVNLLLNTNQDRFAFNSVQVKTLPACYRPPQGTFSGTVNS